LRPAVAGAVRLEAKLPLGAVMELLRHDEPQIRADACRRTRRWGEAIPLLRELLDDLHRDVRVAAACALGRMGGARLSTATTGCRARPILRAAAGPWTSCSAGSNSEFQSLVGQEGGVKIEFAIERTLDVVGSTEPVLLTIEQ
jgi:hypothetical protein